jgi:hypothetical protein
LRSKGISGRLDGEFHRHRNRAADEFAKLAHDPDDEHVYRLSTTEEVLSRACAIMDRAKEIILVDAFPGFWDRLRSSAVQAQARGVTVLAKLYIPEHLAGIRVFFPHDAAGSLTTWRGHPLNAHRPPLRHVSPKLVNNPTVRRGRAAVHSVGVVHKDLKPSNVLVRSLADNEIEILLGDFGSGGVLDGNRLEELGITRLGFTKTVASIDCSSATPLYLAPEILAGQRFTVKSDIYALGIILYQFLAGDFHKVMSPGWERGIEDGLLRQDIALMAEGNPAERMEDADGLARRLRALDERRRQLAAESE